jgi:hypothetical protein
VGKSTRSASVATGKSLNIDDLSPKLPSFEYGQNVMTFFDIYQKMSHCHGLLMFRRLELLDTIRNISESGVVDINLHVEL